MRFKLREQASISRAARYCVSAAVARARTDRISAAAVCDVFLLDNFLFFCAADIMNNRG